MRGCLWASFLVCVLGGVSSTPCLTEEFACVRGGCLSEEHVCDFKANCEDGSDETNCKYENQIDKHVFLFFFSVCLLCFHWPTKLMALWFLPLFTTGF